MDQSILPKEEKERVACITWYLTGWNSKSWILFCIDNFEVFFLLNNFEDKKSSQRTLNSSCIHWIHPIILGLIYLYVDMVRCGGGVCLVVRWVLFFHHFLCICVVISLWWHRFKLTSKYYYYHKNWKTQLCQPMMVLEKGYLYDFYKSNDIWPLMW